MALMRIFSDTGGWFNQTYQSTNYWVDLVFDTGPLPPDTIAPTVGSVVPADDAAGIAVSDQCYRHL